MINILPGIDSTASALNAERIRMDVITQNIANANTSIRGADGKPFQRQQVVFENVLRAQSGGDGSGSPTQTVQVARIEKDSRPPQLVYNPGHADADGNGMVAMPNINIYEDMIELMSASRSYEANLSVVKTARSMALQTLSIGKR